MKNNENENSQLSNVYFDKSDNTNQNFFFCELEDVIMISFSPNMLLDLSLKN